MKLRLRLTVVTVAVTIPMVLGLVVVDARARQQAAEDELLRFVVDRLEGTQGREACEQGSLNHPMPPEGRSPEGRPPEGRPPEGRPPEGRSPEGRPPEGRPPEGRSPEGRPPEDRPPDGRWGMHREPARLYGYDPRGQSLDPRAPALDPAELDGLAEAEVVSRSTLWNAGQVEILLRTPWGTGSCAHVLATGTKEPWLGAILPPTRVWLLPVLVVFSAIVIAVGPFVRRLRRLAASVEQQATSGYLRDVEPDPGRDEVAELARAFEAAGRQVRAQLAQKDRREQALRDFLADTTHDVMIPLTVLQGHLAALRDRVGADEPVEPRVVGSAMQEAHYIASLLHNLAMIARLDAEDQPLRRGPVDLGALVQRVVARHRPIGEQLGVSLECSLPDPPRQIRADVTLLEQALGNLVYNAVRHNRPGGHVAVYVDDTSQDRFVVHVVDDGPGVGEGTLAQLRERGVRGDEARTRAPGGRGLGLDIALRVCELHAYALRMDPAEGGGLHVRVEGPNSNSG